jgi:hypothetical protein
MPLLKFTPADIQKSKLLDDGWYGLTVKKCTDWVPSKDGKSLNLTVSMVVEGENDKEIDYIINNTGMGFHVALFAAVMGIPVKKVQDEPALLESFDTESLPGKKVDGHIIQNTFNGSTNNKIANQGFLPYGKGRAMAAQSVY